MDWKLGWNILPKSSPAHTMNHVLKLFIHKVWYLQLCVQQQLYICHKLDILITFLVTEMQFFLME